jgi:hypothetical protein
MNDDREARIRARAYERWERDGRPEGRAEEHWAEAERELDGSAGISNRSPDEEEARQQKIPPRQESKPTADDGSRDR